MIDQLDANNEKPQNEAGVFYGTKPSYTAYTYDSLSQGILSLIKSKQ